jgi:hypothetical protein
MSTTSKTSTKRFSRSFVGLVVGLVVLAAGLWLFDIAWNRSGTDPIRSEDIHPAGRWHYQPNLDLGDRSSEELARILSLPYLDAKAVAPATSGVTIHSVEQVAPGVNLYVSGHGSEATLMDIDGEFLHRWEMTFEEAFPDKSTSPGTDYFRRAQVFANGDLLAIYQGGGMIKLDVRSRLIWAFDLSFYNDFFVAADGRIWGVAKEAVGRPEIRQGSPVLEDSIVVLSPEGKLLDRFSLLDAFSQSPYAKLMHPLPDVADIFHTNTVEVMDGSMASLSPLYSAGRILVSLRQVDIVAFLDPETRRIDSAWRGPWVMQHQPTLLPSGRLLIFDNRGADDLTRVLEFDTDTEEISWEYRGQPDQPLSSPEGGSAQLLSNDNILITESERGRAIEITPAGEVVWEFVSPHRGGRHGELVATLWEIVRLDFEEVPFVSHRLAK